MKTKEEIRDSLNEHILALKNKKRKGKKKEFSENLIFILKWVLNEN